ncbi:hypothetical protein jhhlp_002259 [Lomentospora prolificans]|uniref:Nucleotide exchange factor SIL1 n=1 Tax=Lomentospora prolificans TaxID=41688 RepID=A0A2N3NDN1_9PEZI|nr:hypothetical protein jhhlp_002259 [Lomentospora prolificans]
MAPSRAVRKLPARPAIAIFFLLLGIILLSAPAVRASTGADGSTQLPEDQEFICHTDNPAECYPRVFQPTDEFQTVHDDQELPHGLHVRVNIWTGQKEAKINVPDEIDPSLEGLPVDKAVVTVEPNGEEQEQGDAEPRIPEGAPAYEPVGKIKVPAVEETGFWDALAVIKAGETATNEVFQDALDSLHDISSDIYYGLKLTEDKDVTRALLCLMVRSDAAPDNRQAAARILAGAMQNNVNALEQVAKEWENYMASSCGVSTLRHAFYTGFMPSATENPPTAIVSRVGSTIFAIKGLIQSPLIRDDFLANGGMTNLLEVIAASDDRWDPAQRKVGHLLLDTFLDFDTGASLGVWPRGDVDSADTCAEKSGAQRDGCWEYYLKRIVERHRNDKGGHWSDEVYDKLRAARKGSTKGRSSKDEL